MLYKQFAYDYCSTSIGEILLITNGTALVQIGFSNLSIDNLKSKYLSKYQIKLTAAEAELQEYKKQIEKYLKGKIVNFTFNWNPIGIKDFQLEVLNELSQIAYGKLKTYKEIAKSINRPLAVRAVGNACGSNPLPIVIPCHRVVRTDGSLGNYTGGIKIKQTLLDIERAKF